MKRLFCYCSLTRSLLAAVSLLAAAPGIARATNLIWVGAFNANWAFNGGGGVTNWAGLLPTGGDDILNFPSTSGNKTMNNNFPDGTVFVQLRFAGPGYVLNGNSFDLNSSATAAPEILVAHGAGTTDIQTDFREVSLSAGLTITVTDPAAVLVLGGQIEGSFQVLGAGTVEMRGGQDYKATSGVTVGSGSDSPTLNVNTDITGNVTVNEGATLAGSGDFGDSLADTLTIRGVVSPGESSGGFQTRTMRVPGNLTFTGTGRAVMELQNLGAGSDKLQVAGSVTTAGATIEILPLRGFPIGSNFVLLEKQSAGPINNAQPFQLPNGQNINEDTEVNLGSNRFRFSYTGGDGNDFTATVVLASQLGLREWDAGGTTRLFSEIANWTPNTKPVSSNILRFGSAAPTVPLDRRFPINDIGGNFFALEFTSGGYTIEEETPVSSPNTPTPSPSATDLTLAGGITASHPSGGADLDQDIILGADQTFALTGAGNLKFGLDHTVNTNGHQLTVTNTNTGDLRFNGAITGTGNLVQTGTGTVLMSGAGVHAYSGGTEVLGGEMRLSRSSLNGGVPGALTIGGGSTTAEVITTATQQIADTATITLLTNGSLQPGAAETIGSLAMEGGNVGGTGPLTVMGDITATQNGAISCPIHLDATTVPIGLLNTWNIASGRTLTLSGTLTDSLGAAGGTLTQRKTGAGTLTLSGTATDVNIFLSGGTLLMNTPTPAAASVTLAGGILGGNGQVHDVSAAGIASEISAGSPGAPATLTCSRLSLDSSCTVAVDLAAAAHDILALAAGTSTGQVTLGNAKLRLRQTAALPVGTVRVIVDNDGSDAVSGTFTGLPAGSLISSDRNTYTISYTGGTGNDITLTAVSAPELDAGLGSGTTADGGTLTFPSAKARESSTRDLVIRNLGSASLTFSGSPRVQITGPDAALFSVVNQPPATLAAGASTTVTLRFAPASGGPKTAQLAIATNDSDENPYNLTLTGTAIPAPLVTAFAINPPANGNPGTVNLSLTGSTPDTTMRLEASSNLTTWTAIRTFTTDSIGSAVTGTINDPTHTVRGRRFYRAVIP